MEGNLRVAGARTLLVGTFISIFLIGTAQAQRAHPVYSGKFTLPCQVHWSKNVLGPGNYTITINAAGMPIVATIRKIGGDAVINVMSGARSEHTNGVNALHLKLQVDGQLSVQSLSLADLGIVLTYDRSVARGTVEDASVRPTVAVLLAKK
jgi:hypothetical protein